MTSFRKNLISGGHWCATPYLFFGVFTWSLAEQTHCNFLG